MRLRPVKLLLRVLLCEQPLVEDARGVQQTVPVVLQPVVHPLCQQRIHLRYHPVHPGPVEVVQRSHLSRPKYF